MSGFFEKLAARVTGRREKALSSFDALVAAVADGGKEPAAEQAEAILAEAGRTVADLAAAVDRLRGRRQARATLDRATAAPTELRRVSANLAAADAKRQEAIELVEANHAAAIAPMLDRFHALERSIEDGKRAESQLRDTAHEPPQLAELRQQLARAEEQRDRHLERAGKAQLAARDAATAAQAYGRAESNKAAYREEAERQMVGVEQHVAAAEPFAEEARRLEKKIAEVENLALTP